MLTQPIFSVVIPMYNVEKYIEKCIQSVLNQSFGQYEIVCVDDGCTDNTVDIVKQFSDPRIRIISQKNKGLAAARNTGISESRGMYVALLDSDDFWASEKLRVHYKHLQKNPEVGVSYSESAFVDEKGECMGICQKPKLKNITAEHIVCRNPVGNGSAAVMRTAMLEEVVRIYYIGGERRFCYFDENMRQSEDIELWLRVALDTKWKFEGVGKPLTYYRVNASGLSANLEKQFESWEYAYKKNSALHSEFMNKWYSLAAAYQYRYLARRAIQSRNRWSAIKLVNKAIISDWRIIIQEPKRTTITCVCAVLCLLPKIIYSVIERVGMQTLGRVEIS